MKFIAHLICIIFIYTYVYICIHVFICTFIINLHIFRHSESSKDKSTVEQIATQRNYNKQTKEGSQTVMIWTEIRDILRANNLAQ